MTDSTAVTRADIRKAVLALGLSGRAVCAHSSLRSFGVVEGGADTVVNSFLDEGCTLLTPSFSFDRMVVPPPADMSPPRNGWDYDPAAAGNQPRPESPRAFTTGDTDVERGMGAIAATVAARPGRTRGNHPLCSFSAVGPMAARLTGVQHPMAKLAPLRALVSTGGWVLLMGVGLERMTLIHLAEQRSGRELFRRWALTPDGKRVALVEVAGCSDGFAALWPAVAHLAKEATVGASRWLAFPAAATVDASIAAIRENPDVTSCGSPECLRCTDGRAGGPLIAIPPPPLPPTKADIREKLKSQKKEPIRERLRTLRKMT